MSASQGGAAASLAGYTFSDDLSSVGAYVPDSFGVKELSGAVAVLSGNVLSYTFPAGTTGEQTLTFKTAIPDANYYGSGSQTITNTAKLLDGSTELKSQVGTATFTPQWITKTGASSDASSSESYNPQNRTITWTITANQMGASLSNAVITDVLPYGLTFKSATAQKWQGDSTTGSWTDFDTPKSWSTAPADGEYALGDITTPVQLTIVATVPDAAYTVNQTTYYNAASLGWSGGPVGGISSGSASASVGYTAITKFGSLDQGYLTNQTVHWTVGVDLRGQTVPDAAVYDLLVYGKSLDLSKVTGLPAGLSSSNLTPQYGQKYIGNFAGTATVSVIPITDANGVQVADLLKITGLSAASANTVTFDTQVVDPDIYAGNGTVRVQNTASLFSGTTWLNGATAGVDYASRMLTKELLARGSGLTAQDANDNKTTDPAAGFDYQDKSVIFRLSVNADGLDLTGLQNAAGEALGTATLTDTLPAGWEFADIADNQQFLIFNGTAGSGNSVTATGDALSAAGLVTADFSGATAEGNKTATFTFTTLNAPYVILVKAVPTTETAEGYFSSNQPSTVTNRLTLKTANWTPGIGTAQDVRINSAILSKELDSSKAASQAELTWTVEYKPCEVDAGGTRIEDTLPEGIDLRTDAAGNLLVDGNITITPLTLGINGTYTPGTPLTAEEAAPYISYDGASRVLTFTIPNSTLAYRFTYVTDITGNAGTITNQVKLYGCDAGTVNTEKSYTVVEQAGWATLQRGGSVVIAKTDGSGAALAGAEFTLYAQDGKTVIRRGTTDAGGKLKLRAVPVGTYTLIETAAPTDYNPDTREHTVVVTKNSDNSITTAVDGKTGADANTLTVKNFRIGTTGSLTIAKTVAGNAADKTKTFDFTVTLAGASGSYAYTGSGVPDGSIQSGGTVTLAHGQSITITGLPKGTAYTVSEADYSADGYTTASTGAAGTITADETAAAAFTNTRNVYAPATGSLTISKTVTGDGADPAKKFDFTVTLTNASGAYPYTGAASGTLRSGDTISLAGGESITVMGLPAGAGYTVAEADCTAEGYAAESTGASGAVTAGGTALAAFTNVYTAPTSTETPEEPGTPGNSGTPGDPGVDIGENGVPGGSMTGGGTESGSTMPKTGDTLAGSLAYIGVIFFASALAVLAVAALVLRSQSGRKKRRG